VPDRVSGNRIRRDGEEFRKKSAFESSPCSRCVPKNSLSRAYLVLTIGEGPGEAHPMPNEQKRLQERTVLKGFAIRERAPSGRWRIRFRWGRILGVITGLSVAGVLVLATALYFFFKEVQKFEEVRYVDMFLLPFTLDEHRAKVGDYQIEEATRKLEKGDFETSFTFLREGVQRSPTNLDGRYYLAEFFLNVPSIRDIERAIRILEDGVPYAIDDKRYLDRLMTVLFSNQMDEQIIEISERLLEQNPSPEVTRLLALSAAAAHLYQGDFDEADALVNRYDLDDHSDGVRLSARISWNRGAHRAAISKLENAIGEFPNDEPIYAQLSSFHRELGELDRARQYAVLRNIDAPLAVEPRIGLLYTLSESGQDERADREANAILRQFNKDESAMLDLGNYATDQGKTGLAREIYQYALEQDFNAGPFALLLIESSIVAGDYQDAIQFSEELLKDSPEWLDRHSSVFNSLRAVAYFGVGNENLADLYTDQVLQETNLRVDQLLAVSQRFRQLGGEPFARRVLKHAYAQNPRNQAALTQLIELEISTGNATELGSYLKSLLQMRRPSVEILEQAYDRLSSDRFIYTPDREELLIELETILKPAQQAS